MVALDTAYRALNRWFSRNQRVLPWRNDPSLYRVWISEIMLAQTQVVTVVPYFERFIGRFPTLESLATSTEDEVLQYWAGLGYYSRARNLLKAARQAYSAGRLPLSLEAWLELPGVGPYTAGAITSIALDQPNAILDGNVERVLSRLHRVRRVTDRAYKQRLWSLSLQAVIRAYRLKIRPRNFNQALMELGATVCKPKNPDCESCPLSSVCEAFAKNQIAAFPPKKKRRELITVHERVLAFLTDDGRVLLEKATDGRWRQGLWDFPKPESVRLKRTKLKAWAKVETRHIVTHHKIERESVIYRLPRSDERLLSVSEKLAWIKISEIESGRVGVGAALKRSLRLAIEALQ